MVSTFYDSHGIASRRDPFFWQLNANLNFTILGIIQAPFAMTISQQNKRFSQPQPFNRFGISPTYKAYSLHLGHRTMRFSDYTLSGNLFFGVGADFKPSNNPLRISLMYGRFAKPVARFSEDGQVFAEPSYKRMGFGAKVGYQKTNHEFHFILFKSADDNGSIDPMDSLDIYPEENLVLGVDGKFRISNQIQWKTEYAFSMFTRNTSTPEIFIDEFSFVNNLGDLFVPRASSSYSRALFNELQFTFKKINFNIAHRRVDPDYSTHGSSFINNDFEDFSSGIIFPLLRGKLNATGNIGFQRNNLDDQRQATLSRLIFSSGVTGRVNQKVSFQVNYSNYNSRTRQSVLQRDVLTDTLEYVQLTRNGSSLISYTFGQGDSQSGISLFSTFQDIKDNSGSNSRFFNYTLSFRRNIFSEVILSSSFMVSETRSRNSENIRIGPTINLSKSFRNNKFRTTLSYSNLRNYVGGDFEGNASPLRLNTSIRLGTRQNISIGIYYLSRKYPAETKRQELHELRTNFKYNLRI